MKNRITVKTKDLFLFQKIYLSLRDEHEVTLFSEKEHRSEDTLIFDLDSPHDGSAPDGSITVGFGRGILSRPFSEEELRSALPQDKPASALALGDRIAYLRDREIRLSELEFALLSRLVREGGEFVARDELIKDVWGEGVDGGILNVYIHYLREKLEADGEKIIISSRKNGYKIDEKYLKERENDQNH